MVFETDKRYFILKDIQVRPYFPDCGNRKTSPTLHRRDGEVKRVWSLEVNG